MFSIIGIIIVGAVAGFVARAIMPGKDDMSVPMTIGLGIAGAMMIGLIGWILRVLFTSAKFSDLFNGTTDFDPGGLFLSPIGALIVLWIYNNKVKK